VSFCVEDELTVRQALAALPQGERDVVTLYFWHGLRGDDLARELGTHRRAASRLLEAALEKMRKIIVPKVPRESPIPYEGQN
jgi:DNA-directed RNA polymerase specialized sigma24 family protein